MHPRVASACVHVCSSPANATAEFGGLTLTWFAACSQVKLSPALKNFIAGSTRSYGKVKLVLKHNRFWVETADTKVRVGGNDGRLWDGATMVLGTAPLTSNLA
jgi:hypothetical protein